MFAQLKSKSKTIALDPTILVLTTIKDFAISWLNFFYEDLTFLVDVMFRAWNIVVAKPVSFVGSLFNSPAFRRFTSGCYSIWRACIVTPLNYSLDACRSLIDFTEHAVRTLSQALLTIIQRLSSATNSVWYRMGQICSSIVSSVQHCVTSYIICPIRSVYNFVCSAVNIMKRYANRCQQSLCSLFRSVIGKIAYITSTIAHYLIVVHIDSLLSM